MHLIYQVRILSCDAYFQSNLNVRISFGVSEAKNNIIVLTAGVWGDQISEVSASYIAQKCMNRVLELPKQSGIQDWVRR